MTPQGNGRFCRDCKKVVTDFSKVSFNELSANNSISYTKDTCGNFKAYQLDKPFNNWKDRLVSLYQRISFEPGFKSVSKQFSLLFITFVLIMTGCHRHVRGKVKMDDKSTKWKQKHETAQMTTPGRNSN